MEIKLKYVEPRNWPGVKGMKDMKAGLAYVDMVKQEHQSCGQTVRKFMLDCSLFCRQAVIEGLKQRNVRARFPFQSDNTGSAGQMEKSCKTLTPPDTTKPVP